MLSNFGSILNKVEYMLYASAFDVLSENKELIDEKELATLLPVFIKIFKETSGHLGDKIVETWVEIGGIKALPLLTDALENMSIDYHKGTRARYYLQELKREQLQDKLLELKEEALEKKLPILKELVTLKDDDALVSLAKLLPKEISRLTPSETMSILEILKKYDLWKLVSQQLNFGII